MSDFIVQLLVALFAGALAGLSGAFVGFVKLKQQFYDHLEMDAQKVARHQEKVTHAAEILATSMNHLKDGMTDLKDEIQRLRQRLHRVEGSVIRGESELMKFLEEQLEKRK